VVERQNIKLEVGQEIRIDLTLQPGEQTQVVTVAAEIPLVETTNAKLRLFRVPELLMVSFILGALALISTFLF